MWALSAFVLAMVYSEVLLPVMLSSCGHHFQQKQKKADQKGTPEKCQDQYRGSDGEIKLEITFIIFQN